MQIHLQIPATTGTDTFTDKPLSRSHQKEQKRMALERLGLTIREAFNGTDDFIPLIAAFYDGMRNDHDRPEI